MKIVHKVFERKLEGILFDDIYNGPDGIYIQQGRRTTYLIKRGSDIWWGSVLADGSWRALSVRFNYEGPE